MAVLYDSYTEDLLPDRPGFVVVDGAYLFDWAQWSDANWVELDRIYRALPGWVGYVDQIPYWFGAREQSPPWLLASIEPPGLQVYGELRIEDWRAWHEAFFARIQQLPGRNLEDEYDRCFTS
jgi:hypothetical protein